MSSTVVSVRVPRRLRERMKRLEDRVDWSREIRSFIEETVEKYEMLLLLEEIRERSKARRVHTDSTRHIREDRDRR